MPAADGSDHTVDHMQLSELAVRLARGAGALTVRLRAGGGRSASTRRARRPTGDRGRPGASERWLADELARLRPDDGLLGEEGADRAGGSGVRWVVDPIDGTVNFLYGLRPYAVSVAASGTGRWSPARCTTRPRGRRSAPRWAPGHTWTARRSAAAGSPPSWPPR
jgi:myo-inositol-1(or 4)-monophosphatase